MDAWIDTYHAVRSLTRDGTPVFLTDSAVGLKEEDNLRHLVSNLGSEVSRRGVVPFLTCKHPLEYCTAYADRAVQHGFQALVVLGGDKSLGPPRCVEHAWQLREEIRRHQPELLLGGWANPHGNTAQQVAPSARRACDRRVLPDSDRFAPQPRACSGVRLGGRAARTFDPRDLRRLLLSFGQSADARRTRKLPAGAGRGADRRVRGRRDCRRDLRENDQGAARGRGPPLLYQQPAPAACGAQR